MGNKSRNQKEKRGKFLILSGKSKKIIKSMSAN